ncbi:MAG TPA: PDR/VanB family oxidoreductase [Candidatus Binataceae bacterium]|nr:PDR/VanB family oxidoreductase [Candidatus Binataceae bacterium]
MDDPDRAGDVPALEGASLGPDGHTLRVRVRSIVYQADWINAYEVIDPERKDLPPFTAGSHIDVYFRDGRVRQYSLCNDPAERSRYVFAVQREADGRGGSKAIFELVHVGRILTISQPRNNFPLRENADFHLLLAGGIGITPCLAMIHRLVRIGAAFQLHYCTRGPERTAFKDDLASFAAERKVVFHYDGGVPAQGLNLQRLLAERRPGTHLYACGPAGFIAAVRAGAAHWPKSSVHFELFTALPVEAPDGQAANAPERSDPAFRVKLARSGAVLEVPGDKSIVQVLREHGIEVATSCENGLCGTCRTRCLEGEPEHRDYVLDDKERSEYVLICCARSRSPLLVLDL